MTEKELASNLGIKIEVFEDVLFPDGSILYSCFKNNVP